MPTLSLCVIVRNEAAVIDRCLASVAGAVDHTIVVDTGSTDDTAERARAAGAEVVSFPWCNDFAAARNASLDHARGDWVLVLDADEVLTPGSRASLRPLVAGATTAAFWVVLRNTQPPGELVCFVDTRIVRLFRNHPSYRFRGIIHESIERSILETGALIAASPIVVVHDGYTNASVQGGVDRGTRNLALLQAAAAREPTDAYWQYQLGATYQQLHRPVEARRHLWQALQGDGGTLTTEVRALAATKLAQLALAERRHASAVAYATRALDAAPNGCIARMVLALALMYLRRFREALPHLEWLQTNGRSQLSASDDLDALTAACLQQAAPPP
jgi:hypothetical protein